MAHGDLLLQICADTAEATIYALFDVIRQTSAMMVPRRQFAGFLPPKLLTAAESTGRNTLGFKDGTANPSTKDAGLMDSLLWVLPGAADEPAWPAGAVIR